MASCRCAGCRGLEERYKTDPELLKHYRKRLLIRGWAGKTDDVEKAYQKAHSTWANRGDVGAFQNARRTA